MRDKGYRRNLFLDSKLRSYECQFGSSINLNGYQPIQSFHRHGSPDGYISVDKDKRWEMTSLECTTLNGVKKIPIVKEMQFLLRKNQSSRTSALTLFPNQTKRNDSRYVYPVIKIRDPNILRRDHKPSRKILYEEKRKQYWDDFFIQPIKPKVFKYDLLRDYQDVLDGYCDGAT